MRSVVTVWLLTLASLALAGGSQPKMSPLGVPWIDTVTLRCNSGRNIVKFAPNTQFIRLYYRGQVFSLQPFSQPAGIRTPYFRDSDVGLRSMLSNADSSRLGVGMDWRSFPASDNSWDHFDLYRVYQRADGSRRYTLLERCRG